MVLGERQLAAVPLATTTALSEGQGIMGNAFLDDFVVTIDWTADALYLDPVSDDPGPEVPLSVSPTWHDGFVVGSVVEGAPGTTGIELDAPILAIDGEDVSRATVDDACRRLTDASRHADLPDGGRRCPHRRRGRPRAGLLRRAPGDQPCPQPWRRPWLRSWLRRLIPIR